MFQMVGEPRFIDSSELVIRLFSFGQELDLLIIVIVQMLCSECLRYQSETSDCLRCHATDIVFYCNELFQKLSILQFVMPYISSWKAKKMKTLQHSITHSCFSGLVIRDQQHHHRCFSNSERYCVSTQYMVLKQVPRPTLYYTALHLLYCIVLYSRPIVFFLQNNAVFQYTHCRL